jgi:hypothetical protein
MADLTDVANALVSAIAAIVYPSGTGSPSIAATPIVVYQGWPNPQQLDADLATGKCHVSVYPRPEERITTRYAPDWKPTTLNTPTLTLTIVGQTFVLAGTVPPAGNPHNVMAFANGKPYVYATLVSDTLASIATALAALISVDIGAASAAGAVVTLPNSARLNGARVGVTGSSTREVRRQERLFQIGIWCDTPAHRDAIAQAIDSVLAFTTFLTLSDQSAGRLIYKNSLVSDLFQKDRLYRRDLMYTVEYGTTQTETDTQITQEQLNVSAAPSGTLPYGAASTTFI